MKSEAQTIEDFIIRKLASPQVMVLTESWRIEPEVIVNILVSHFRDIGIFFVERNQEALMQKNLLHHLKHSPELIREIIRATNDESAKRRTRHAG